MLTQNKNTRFTYLRILIVLPLLTIVVSLFAFRKNEIKAHFELTKSYKIVIDAGHGGDDLGCKSIDGTVNEKDVDLAIAKAIKQLNADKNIEIVLTRNDDHFDDLKTKAEFINNQKADLCVSIHCSVDDKNNEMSGTEIYVVSPEKNNAFMDKSIELAQSMNAIMKNDLTDREIKIRKQGIWILNATKCPAILIEAGFLSNRTDAAMLVNADKQALIAKSILTGIENYLALTEKK
jgi:N-acetylmuramoyl-L-alanine amidase